MPAELRGDHAVIEDAQEASRVHNKGWFGTPLPGGSLRLEPVEVLFLAEGGRLEARSGGQPLGPEELTKWAVGLEKGFEIRYLVYSDLKQRGLSVRMLAPGPPDFAVYDRGVVPSRALTRYHVLARSERAEFDVEELRRFVERSGELRKCVLLALVDEEGDLTYYEVSRLEPAGTARKAELGCPGKGLLLDERVLVFDGELAGRLREGYFGRPAGQALQLSLLEAAYLVQEGVLELSGARSGKPVGLSRLLKGARDGQGDFDLRLKVFRDLRSRGFVVRTGFKFGTHFRVYEGDPDGTHARYLVHAVPGGYVSSWPEVSRAVRLAHGVKKEMLLARVGRDTVYLKVGRTRP